MSILDDQNLVMNGMIAKMMQHLHPMHRDSNGEISKDKVYAIVSCLR